MREDLKCANCAENEANYLIFRETYISDCGKIAFLDPKIVCEECKKFFPQEYNVISFQDLGQMDLKKIGWLLSKKGKETNSLNNKFWRKKLYRIRYIYSESKP